MFIDVSFGFDVYFVRARKRERGREGEHEGSDAGNEFAVWRKRWRDRMIMYIEVDCVL